MAFLGWVAFAFLGSMFNGYALSIMLQWFMVPTLGLPVIGIAQATGISLVASYLTNHNRGDEAKKEGGGD